MTHTYNISGMTCNSCVAKAKSELLKLGDVSEAQVQLTEPQATITMQRHIPVAVLQSALNKAGKYTVTEADGGMHHAAKTEEPKTWLATYKPILLIFSYIIILSFLTATSAGGINWMSWMRTFMSGFFSPFLFLSCWT